MIIHDVNSADLVATDYLNCLLYRHLAGNLLMQPAWPYHSLKISAKVSSAAEYPYCRAFVPSIFQPDLLSSPSSFYSFSSASSSLFSYPFFRSVLPPAIRSPTWSATPNRAVSLLCQSICLFVCLRYKRVQCLGPVRIRGVCQCLYLPGLTQRSWYWPHSILLSGRVERGYSVWPPARLPPLPSPPVFCVCDSKS